MWPCAVANRGSVAPDRETSMRRSLEVLLSLGSDEAIEDGGMGVTRISEMLGREKSQVSRTLKALAEFGLVDRNRDALAYRLGWRIYALAAARGRAAAARRRGPAAAAAGLETQERAYFSVLQGADTLTILSESSGHAVQAVGWVGRVTPAYCTSVGQALLLDHDPPRARPAVRRAPSCTAGPNTARTSRSSRRASRRPRARGCDRRRGARARPRLRRGAGARCRRRIVAALNVSAPKFRVEGQEDGSVRGRARRRSGPRRAPRRPRGAAVDAA